MSSTSVNGIGQSLHQFRQSIAAPSQSSATGPARPQGPNPPPAPGQQPPPPPPGAMFKKLEAAVTNALQSASSDNSADPNDVIQSAIAKVLQDDAGSAPAPSDAPSDPPAAAAPDQDRAARQSFFQLLKDHGVDPRQFHQDLLAAIKDARAGHADASTAFKSFPVGSSVDQSA